MLQHKIVSIDELKKQLNIHRMHSRKIVFTNGCFDILHKGHVLYLDKANKLGNILVLGLNTDASVQRLKGNNRPYTKEQDRATVLAGLQSVDYIVLFDEDTPYELIKTVQPDVLAKGADYTNKEVVGRDIVEAKGGKVELIEFEEGYSSSDIIKSIQK
jgi:D-beta-D-heptose 7-phosphate kinase / D-beta-D-heptose 1-phosphate adenosyltransferase